MSEKHLVDRRFVERKSSYDIKQLWEHHHQILRLVAVGMSNGDIAEQLNISPQTVSNVRNSPLAQDKLAEFGMQLDEETVTLAQRIQNFTPTALQLLEDIISGRIEATTGLQAKTAENYLARAGYGPLHKAVSVSQHLTPEDIARLKARATNAHAMEAEYHEVNSSD